VTVGNASYQRSDWPDQVGNKQSDEGIDYRFEKGEGARLFHPDTSIVLVGLICIFTFYPFL
jgi:hypothetical protein